MAKYTIILEPNYPEEGYTVRVPALPGCITYGRTKEEAMTRAKEAIAGFIEGLEKAGYLTSDTALQMNQLPESIAIVGGGFISAEYGHFFSAMGSKVTIIGSNPAFLKQEEPEVSTLAKREMQKHMTILTNYEAHKAETTSTGQKRLVAVNRVKKGIPMIVIPAT